MRPPVLQPGASIVVAHEQWLNPAAAAAKIPLACSHIPDYTQLYE
jgi:hypothetical protein